METSLPSGHTPALPSGHTPAACRAREILERIGDKWSLYVISQLSDRTKRFNELKRDIDGISQRMLTVTLRGLERDGIVSRTMYPVMPPRVDYTLTPLGRTLLDTVGFLIHWAEEHVEEIETTRALYDTRVERFHTPE
ncbi:winged helix-turn-helix transcriptional regulator [Streptosporangium roseum]|uniref:Transcriptional regulator n=1 Tax=Streptosporangium roseum (strain ATCC 12428 / DSM 43021 / JCM 3005 / KCTC 9067 / NCIMB 10171 / NRRL 2505 / NI 9100) TaxID=479432 RepID=D2B5S0_STRRD|nr:helix-turn-helix domain-containing protein [Streptosporangium roseum]ACZ91374.1 putative transcriptional regulator [Streptosporangium roseum DSM 43021]